MSMLRNALLLALTVLSTPTHAIDNWANFPGAKCVKSGTAGTLSVNLGRARNSSTAATLTLSCPVDRQFLVGGGTNDGSQAWVIDDSSADDAYCTFYVRDLVTNTTSSSETVSVPAGTDGPDPVELSFSAAAAGDDEVYHLSCVLPARDAGDYSYLLGARIVEIE